jgi:hypothetical protein
VLERVSGVAALLGQPSDLRPRSSAAPVGIVDCIAWVGIVGWQLGLGW